MFFNYVKQDYSLHLHTFFQEMGVTYLIIRLLSADMLKEMVVSSQETLFVSPCVFMIVKVENFVNIMFCILYIELNSVLSWHVNEGK